MTATNITGSQEHDLYRNDRPAWLKLVAPRMAAKLRAMPQIEVAEEWAQLPRDYQRAVWAVLDNTTREAVRMARLPEFHTVSDCPMPEHGFDLFEPATGGVPA